MRLFTDHFRLFGLKQREISLRHSLSRIKKINVETRRKQEAKRGERGECDCKKDVCLRKDNSTLTHGAETRQMLAIPVHSKEFRVSEPCPNCHNGGGKR